MKITFNRTPEDRQEIRRVVKNLRLKVPQKKLIICILVGLVFFFYNGDGINSTFTGYTMVAAFFWGAATMIYFDKFFPKLNVDPKMVISSYAKQQSPAANSKVEINDTCISFDHFESYVSMQWENFNFFRINKKYIFLMISENDLSTGMIIKLSELSEDQYNEFYNFLREKLTQKK